MGPRQRQGHSRSKTHALPIILLSFLGFLLIAGVAFGIGMVGNVNRWLSDLPDYTDANAYLVSEPTEIVDCNGNKIASFYTQNRKSITKDEVSPYVLQGTVDVEDERFYEHGGIDLWGIARAAVATLGGGHEGASTITQQLVRNTILQEEQFDSTIERKVREAYIAIKMEDMYSKDEILMMYLNTIYYGHGAYGIEAAAETYLSKSAADLTLSEAALLIGLPNSPSQYDPTVNPDLALSRRNKVLDNMLRLGHITEGYARQLNLSADNEELKLRHDAEAKLQALSRQFATAASRADTPDGNALQGGDYRLLADNFPMSVEEFSALCERNKNNPTLLRKAIEYGDKHGGMAPYAKKYYRSASERTAMFNKFIRYCSGVLEAEPTSPSRGEAYWNMIAKEAAPWATL